MISRRELIRSVPPSLAVAATLTIPAIAEVAKNPDAELFRLGAEFDRLRAEYLPLEAESQRCLQAWLEQCNQRGVSLDVDQASGERIAQQVGSVDADARTIPVERAFHATIEALLMMPAATLAGLAIKAKVIRLAVLFQDHDEEEPTEEEYLRLDWHEEVPMRFLFEVERLAAKDNAVTA